MTWGKRGMEYTVFSIYCLLAFSALVQAALAGLQTWEHRRFARSRLQNLNNYRPRGKAMLFAPCKGIDLDLQRNLQRLYDQDYEEYEITFIVQSRSDPACELLKKVMAKNPHIRSHLVIAGKADATGSTKNSGQKVHNLRVATENLSPDIDYLVFVDSDAQPRREWLRALLGRLGSRRRTDMGASTGYRWMVPQRASLANYLLYSINCGVTTLLGSRGCYPVWGGSWALRRETFEAIDLHGQWEGTLSDDLVASQILNKQNRPVQYEPACLVASPVDNNFYDTFSFLRRQYLITRFYVPGWWTMGIATITIANLIWPASFAAIAFGLWSGSSLFASAFLWLPAAVLTTFYAMGVYRGWLRQSLIGLYFPHLREKLRGPRLFDIWVGPLAALAHWVALISASCGRTITWRNITYRLYRGGRVETVSKYPLKLKAFDGTEVVQEGLTAEADTIEPLIAEAEKRSGSQRAA